MAVKLIPIRFRNKKYPSSIEPKVSIKEVAGKFSVNKVIISQNCKISLHTEYASPHKSDKILNNPLLKDLDTIKGSMIKFGRKLIPRLWVSKGWVKEFVVFIERLVQNRSNLKIIEIHPPFKSDCKSIKDFIEVYEVFETEILKVFPGTEILLENRSGTLRGEFLISTAEDLSELCSIIGAKSLKLRIALDFPALFTSYGLGPENITAEDIKSKIQLVYSFRDYISGIHIWSKKLTSHHGNLDDYFKSKSLKQTFLKEVYKLLDDGGERYFLPEVFEQKDFETVVNDFKELGFEFRKV